MGPDRRGTHSRGEAWQSVPLLAGQTASAITAGRSPRSWVPQLLPARSMSARLAHSFAFPLLKRGDCGCSPPTSKVGSVEHGKDLLLHHLGPAFIRLTAPHAAKSWARCSNSAGVRFIIHAIVLPGLVMQPYLESVIRADGIRIFVVICFELFARLTSPVY
jgi:hypothetical protein